MCSLDHFADAVACASVRRRITHITKLDDDNIRFILEGKCRYLIRKEAEIRWELQRDGHRPTVNNNFGIWVEHVARIKDQFDDLSDSAQQNRNDVHQLLREVDSLLQSASSLLSHGIPRRESQIFLGIVEPKITKQIWECLMDPTIGTVGLYGPGGVGKTTTIMNITNQLARTDTFDKIIWVTMAKKASPERVGYNIAMQLGNDLSKYPHKSQLERVHESLKNMERCLFIFDDMWLPASEWIRTVIPAPTRENGFKIVIISRFHAVCEQTAADTVINLAPLSDSDAWDLFITKTGDHVLDPEIQGIAKEILKECAGLPITVVTVGRAMKDWTDAIAWRQTLNYLRREIQEIGMDHIFSLLRFCYRRLKSERIRWCFLYCGLFPEDYKFKSKELVGYWIAEDYTQNSGDIVASTNEGNEILRELIDANMLGMFMEGGNEFLKMHDIIRDFAICMLNQETETVAKPGQWLIEHFSFNTKHLRAKTVSLIGNQIVALYSNCICSHLSTLLLKDNPLIDVLPSFFSHVPNLQILDMSHSAVALLPPSLCELSKLRALFLQYCTYLSHIPSLGKLRELQYLNLSGTLLKELPRETEMLVNLRSLDLSDTIILEYIHPGVISSLTNLEELLMQGSGICKIDSPAAKECLKEIRCLKRLSILTLSAIGFQDHLDTILHLQGYNLKIFSVNVYGSAEDCVTV